MLLISIVVYALLILIAWQDYAYRAVYWWLFVLLFLALGSSSYLVWGFRVSAERVLYNATFLIVQILLLSVYFSLKQKRLVNIFKGYFGLGDLCFLLSISICFSLPDYIFFYMFSLLLVILITAGIRFFKRTDASKIPLAGYQAIGLALLMFFDSVLQASALSSAFPLWKYFN